MEFAQLCWNHIKNLFDEILECRVFELFKYGKERGDFLLSRHAKVPICFFLGLHNIPEVLEYRPIVFFFPPSPPNKQKQNDPIAV